MHAGYWTEQNERWFVERRNNIRAGKALPLTAKKWKDYLKYADDKTAALLGTVTQMTEDALKDPVVE